eukprot:GHVT01039436.1.p1 GENE.GHVT01039436.1~~GHVT01039436.1.p1  ORF type:complete len:338 (-),score=19.96 GHVT01039436.1:2282-3295(-)
MMAWSRLWFRSVQLIAFLLVSGTWIAAIVSAQTFDDSESSPLVHDDAEPATPERLGVLSEVSWRHSNESPDGVVRMHSPSGISNEFPEDINVPAAPLAATPSYNLSVEPYTSSPKPNPQNNSPPMLKVVPSFRTSKQKQKRAEGTYDTRSCDESAIEYERAIPPKPMKQVAMLKPKLILGAVVLATIGVAGCYLMDKYPSNPDYDEKYYTANGIMRKTLPNRDIEFTRKWTISPYLFDADQRQNNPVFKACELEKELLQNCIYAPPSAIMNMAHSLRKKDLTSNEKNIVVERELKRCSKSPFQNRHTSCTRRRFQNCNIFGNIKRKVIWVDSTGSTL